MKQVYLIPMSLNEKDNENKINEAIQKIGKDSSITWLANLIKSLDEDKYMLVAEKEEGEGTLTPEKRVLFWQSSLTHLSKKTSFNQHSSMITRLRSAHLPRKSRMIRCSPKDLNISSMRPNSAMHSAS